ncbi:ribokinase [Schaalia sp. ZJ405]|uniref:ribokinase n=1 Tax=Schaalia sp. ZJ405 TaxID=2709403 RepID=UPI0013ECE093|nr:ribokinase [Schaalia sp. ZJ405]QPK81276.1 ribokinase [Schaalia sp. ZJ405]
MDSTAHVVVIGSYAKALVMTADRIPLAGETLVGRDYRQTYGGKGSDMAIQAARLGAEVDFLGVVGADLFGDEFRELLTAEGISSDRTRVSETRPTGVGFIIKDTDARNVIVVDMGANEEFSPDDIDQRLPRGRQNSVALAQLEVPLDTALYGLRAAKDRGMRTILNPAPAVSLRGRTLEYVDILTPNESEARVLLGLEPDDDISNEEVARRLFDIGVKNVVITLGSKGSLIATPDKTLMVRPIPVDVVDSNGAGDSFNAALAVGLSEEMNLEQASEFASAVSGLCCMDWETVPSYKYRDEVYRYLELVE